MDRDRAIVTLQSPDDRSDGVEGFWKNSKIAARSNRDRGSIEPRSRRDRTAIAARSSRDRGVCMVESPPIEQKSIDERPGPRSWPDRGAIVAQSRPDHGPIAAKMQDIRRQN